MPKLVSAGVTLRSQIDKRFPRRDKRSDGWIGDKAHQARISDHNPDAEGWVHAIDIDADLGKPGDAQLLADQIVAYAASGLPGANRIRYVVFNDQVASGTYSKTRWQWRGRGYGHREHIHVSFLKAAEKDPRPFPLPIFGKA
jgi:hypothetical protein